MDFKTDIRGKQLMFLDKCDSKESLSSNSLYIIYSWDRKTVLDKCNCAGTASMILATQYSKTNVWIKRV